jgi:nitrate reductase molybdenum cofactor assembly chaperone NarJ/NarW
MDRALALFADALSYPGEDMPALARELEMAAVASGFPAGPLSDFRRFVEGTAPERLEELYTATFDLNPDSSPYIGYHLYGDGYPRSMFLLELQKKYRARGFEAGRELADHLCVMLRFLSDCDDPGERDELIAEALVPALHSMIEKTVAVEGLDATPYRLILQAMETGFTGG